MYDALYSAYYRGRNCLDVEVFILPRFGIVFNKEADEKLYWDSGCYYGIKECQEEEEIKLEEETRWAVCMSEHLCQVYVTERKTMFMLDCDERIRRLIAEKMQDAKREYQMEKKEQKRLYFYDASERKLTQYYANTVCDCELRYDLNRDAYQQIDKNFLSSMEESCFVLGRIRRTIWTQNGKQLDFIEPLAKFKIDSKNDLFGEETAKLGEELFELLQCFVQKVHSAKITTRVIGKMQCTMKAFLKDIRRALHSGDVEQVKFLYEILKEPQDCSKENFRILENADDDGYNERGKIECNATDGIWIQYENGEKEKRSVRWIEENISRCLTKKFSYYVK